MKFIIHYENDMKNHSREKKKSLLLLGSQIKHISKCFQHLKRSKQPRCRMILCTTASCFTNQNLLFFAAPVNFNLKKKDREIA